MCEPEDDKQRHGVGAYSPESQRHEKVSLKSFYRALHGAAILRPKLVNRMPSMDPTYYYPYNLYINQYQTSGFAISEDGTLIAMFSTYRNRGHIILREAMRFGAVRVEITNNPHLEELFKHSCWNVYHRTFLKGVLHPESSVVLMGISAFKASEFNSAAYDSEKKGAANVVEKVGP
jgi:hypothetical protein